MRHSMPNSNVRLRRKYGAIGSGARLAAVRPVECGRFALELQRRAAQMAVLLAVRAPTFQIERDAARRHRKRQLETIDVGQRTR